MSVVARTTRYANYTLTALVVLSGLASLYLWVEAIMWWGDAMAFASAMTWSVVTVALVGLSTVVGVVGAGGD